MEINFSVKTQCVTAFQDCKKTQVKWSEKRNAYVTVRHCGFVADASNKVEAAANLISMVRPMHPALGDLMLKDLYNNGVV